MYNLITRVTNKYGENVGAIIQLVGNGQIQATKQKDQGQIQATKQKYQGCRPLKNPRMEMKGGGLGGLGHSGPLVTISSPSVICSPRPPDRTAARLRRRA